MTIEPEGFLTGIKGGLSRENISARFRAIRKTLGGIPRATVLHYSILSLTLALAAIIRLLPLRWGAYISEFDPYFNFNDMRAITASGWQSWYSYVNFAAWYPFGRPPVSTSYPGTSFTGTLIYSMLSSVSLIYMSFAWGSFRYAAEVLGLFTLALIVLGRYTPRLLLSYGITIGFFLFTGTELPLLGHTYLTESTTVALLGVMGLLAVMELSRLAPTSRGRLTVLGLAIAGVVAIAVLGVGTGLISAGLRGKFLATLDPFVRNNIPLVASVAENRPSTWSSLYLEIGSVILLAVFGFFFAFQRLRDSDVLLIVFGVTGFYFAASLVRLTLILAPAMATLAAITVVELGKPAMDIIQQAVIFPRRKLRFTSRVSREFSLGILLIILILVVPTFINAVQSAYTPTTIASASLPVRGNFPDWLQALTWMNNNLPHSSVVFAWWDYGYWITVNTGLATLSDNGKGNTTAIQDIATGFMLNESLAVQLMRQERVTHVAIFISYNRGLCGSNV